MQWILHKDGSVAGKEIICFGCECMDASDAEIDCCHTYEWVLLSLRWNDAMRMCGCFCC